MPAFARSFSLKLYPNAAQRQAMTRFAGTCRWLWNHLLELQNTTYDATGMFVFSAGMQKLLPGLKQQVAWLGETPSCALQRVCKHLDRALRDSFRTAKNRKQFPVFKEYGGEAAFYVANDRMRIEGRKVFLPKLGAVKFRTGKLPRGKILGATVVRKGDDWFCQVQCLVETDVPVVEPGAATCRGGDVGLKTMMVVSDGSSWHMPKAEKRLMRRIRLLYKSVSRKVKRSANREKARRRLAVAMNALRNLRQDARHKLTRALVDGSSVLVVEDLNVKAMMKGLRLGKSVGETGLGEIRRQLTYKAEWAGVTLVLADRWFPSTQTCSCCGTVLQGDDRLGLKDRTYRCDCGHEMDRDLNAAMNLRRYGLDKLGLDVDVPEQPLGEAIPVFPDQLRVKACGDPNFGVPVARPGLDAGQGSRNRLPAWETTNRCE